MSDEQGAVEKLAAVLHPDAFDHRARNATGYAAKWFEAAAASAKKQAARAVAAGWIGPEAARWAKADLENAREAGEVYRHRAARAEATIARVEALADDLDKKSEAAYEQRYTEDWAYHEGRGDVYEEAERLIREALAEPGTP